MQAAMLQDRYNRRFPYLRLSVTEACNFRCTYCLPDGYKKTAPHNFLSVDEIRNLVRAFAGLGIRKVRLTGGEPTLRADLADIISVIAETPGIETVALTTNGYKLTRSLADYQAAGLSALNVSVDSLMPDRFKAITGHDRLQEVLGGIALAEELGFRAVKINTVLQRGVNDDELPGFLKLIRKRPLSVRFIELMRTGDSAAYFAERHLDPAPMISFLAAASWAEQERYATDGPARVFRHREYAGSIGFIAPYSKDFCSTCNRLRISARGGLQLCLFGNDIFDLRRFLTREDTLETMQDRVATLLGLKRESHELIEGKSGRTRHLAMIGG